MPSPAIVRAMREAVAHHQAGRIAQAEAIYRRVLQQDPRDADALHLLGLLHHQAGRNDVAVEMISKAMTIRPRAEFLVNLGQAYKGLGRTRAALETCQRAVQMGPNIAEAWNNLGSALKDADRLSEAIAAFEKAIKLRPNYAVALNNLGNSLALQNKPKEAEAALRGAIAADPRYAEAYSNLAEMIGRMGRVDEAVALARRAIELKPDLVAAYVNLGTALHVQGRLEEGDESFRQGLKLDPDHAGLHENLLNSLNQTARTTPQQAFEAHVAWGEHFAKPPAVIPPHPNVRSLDRKLRIGYVSPDLKRHSVTFFLEPIIEHHDRSRFEITAYSNTVMIDELTDRLRGMCDRWRDIVPLSDDEAAELVRKDEIDILVDLAGHTVRNRLGVFARKPAPVQMTYLGYPNTTGVRAIDYRLTDELADAVGQTDQYHVEKLIRLPAPFLCYRPPTDAPAVVEAPAQRTAYVTFGSFNRASKAGTHTIALWSRVLSAVPGSRLLLKSRGLTDGGSRSRLIDGFASHGITSDRIELVEARQGLAEHLAMYGRIDVALDTFPYHGTTTTCEALWMGVPVVSLIGQTHHSRVGLSLLTSVGCGEWAVQSEGMYVQMCKELASGARSGGAWLRERMKASRLCDELALTKAIEDAYRQAFKAWGAAPV